jgi:hypothetical protein
MNKLILTAGVFFIVLCQVSPAPAQSGRLFLRVPDGYTEIEKLQLQIACLKIELQERERLKEFQFHQLAQEINRLQNRVEIKEKPGVDLSSLEVFNYSLAGIAIDEENQQVVVSILANQKYLRQKSDVEQKRFLSDCFRLISQKLSKALVDYDEYRDLVVRFYPLDYESEPFVEYKEGGYIWSPVR